MRRRWLTLAAVAIGASVTSGARADAGPKFGNGFWLPVGATLGGAFRKDLPDGFVLGAEVSAVYLWMEGDSGGVWIGGVSDAVWDFGTDAFRHRIGPEIGWGPVGIDVTYLGQYRDRGPEGTYDPGINVRGLFTLAVVSIYGGYGHVFVDGDGGSYGEFGALVKFPIPIDVESKAHRVVRPPEPEASGAPLRPVPDAEPEVPSGSEPAPTGPLQPSKPAPGTPNEPDADSPEEQDGPYATPPPPAPPPTPGSAPYDPSGG